MVRRHIHSFLRRRLSSEEYLGLHLTIGLLLCLALMIGFGTVARSVVDKEPLTTQDVSLHEYLVEHREESPLLLGAFRLITRLGNAQFLALLGVLVSLVLLLRRRRSLALVWLLALVTVGLLNSLLKETFDRPRPPTPDAIIHETNQSFPSGHAMGSITAYGLLAYLALRVLHRRWLQVALVAVLASLILAIGFSRVYLGAHYLSDVIGGFALGGAWLTACISGIEVARRRARHHQARHHHHHHHHHHHGHSGHRHPPPPPEAGAAPPG